VFVLVLSPQEEIVHRLFFSLFPKNKQYENLFLRELLMPIFDLKIQKKITNKQKKNKINNKQQIKHKQKK
jgi:hypothetical protein